MKHINKLYAVILIVVSRLNALHPDKRTHIDIGLIVGILSLSIVRWIPVLMVSFLTGIAIELWDKRRPNGSGFDWQDIKYTCYGGLVAQALQLIWLVINN